MAAEWRGGRDEWRHDDNEMNQRGSYMNGNIIYNIILSGVLLRKPGQEGQVGFGGGVWQ